MYQVIKRDGKIAEFDISKISAAIKKAFEATNVEYNDDIIDFLALKVTADYASKVKDGKIQVEDIQDSVERAFCPEAATKKWPRPIFSTENSGKRSAM